MAAKRKSKEVYLPPSGASTWTDCTEQPWFILNNADELKDKEDTDASLDGVLAHALAESILNNTMPPSGRISKAIRENVASYVHFVNSLSNGGVDILRGVELKVPPFYAPHRNAYIDFVSVVKIAKGVIHINIADYKNGVYPVDALLNKQAAIYARSVMPWVESQFPLVGFTVIFNIYIFQPNISDDEDPVRGPWTISAMELGAWTDEHIGNIATNIRARKGLKFAPSDKNCHFCQAATLCPARGADLFADTHALVEVQPMADIVTDPDTIPLDKIIAMLPHVDGLIKFCKKIKGHALELAEKGMITEDDGFKLVRGKGSRHWRDEEATLGALEAVYDLEELAPRVLKSPAKVERLLKDGDVPTKVVKKVLGRLYERSEGRPQLVPSADKRPALEPGDLTADDMAELLKQAHDD